jgi:hypothetical protein
MDRSGAGHAGVREGVDRTRLRGSRAIPRRGREAGELAARLGDIDLQSWAWEARSRAAIARGDYEEGFAWPRRRLDIVAELTDPDHIALIYFFSVDWCIAVGRFEDARRVAEAHDEVASKLTPHHRLHAVMTLITVERAAGRWETIRAMTPRAEAWRPTWPPPVR